jgi:hypothetical protein
MWPFAHGRRSLRASWLALVLCCAALSPAQDTSEPSTTSQPPPTTSLATVHGLVRNAATGSPIPRALVRVEGDAIAGALTDGDGRFELPGLPTGPQELSVIKPGFVDEFAAAARSRVETEPSEFAHNVIVTAEMPDVVFAMEPLNAIRGQILLSSGEPAQSIGVTLSKQTVEDGRLAWRTGPHTSTNADGIFRFGGLSDGTYVVYTEPAMESESASVFVAPASASNLERSGYPAQFYPQAHDLATAARIQLTGGETAEADLSLTLEPFHEVTATALFPGNREPRNTASGLPSVSYSARLSDQQGHPLPYTPQYDQATHSVQALLPDGNYSLALTAEALRVTPNERGGLSIGRDPTHFVGSVNFSVATHGINNLRIPLAAVRSNPVQVNLIRSGAPQTDGGPDRSDAVLLTLTDAGGSNGDGMVSTYAEGSVSESLSTTYTQPGSYWVHTNLHDKRFCEGSLMAGGANLGREPLVLGLTGPTEPLILTLRDDCASLTLSLPAALTALVAGEEPFYTVYVVPEFDSTTDVIPQTLRASTGGTITLHSLTPGTYHVYAFTKPIALAYHDRDVLAKLPNPGQEIELAPGEKANLVLEVPQQ